MRSGSKISASLKGTSGAAREALIFSAVANGEVPSYMASSHWLPVHIKGTDKDGVAHTLIIYVSPRYVEVGTDEDAFMVPMWPETAQRVANKYNAVLPSRKIVEDLWNWAILRLPIAPPAGFTIPGPDMEKTESWIAYNATIQKALHGSQAIMDGGKKDVVVGPALDGSHVAIYSTPFSGTGSLRPTYANGTPAYQPYSTIHAASYSDYSHGVRLVSRDAKLDGEDVDLMDVFTKPKLSFLVSDQGTFSPTFPNAGSKAAYGAPSSSRSVESGISVESGPIVQPPARSVFSASNGSTSIANFLQNDQAKKEAVGTAAGGIVGVAASLAFGLSAWPTVLIGALGAFAGNRIAKKAGA